MSEPVKVWIARWGPDSNHDSVVFFNEPTRHESNGIIWWNDENEDDGCADDFSAPRPFHDLVAPGECRAFLLVEAEDE